MPARLRKPQRQDIVRLLLGWYRRHRRALPWRATRDPYRIWVSEIMLQQTRVSTVLPYYERFLQRFPSVEALAEADEQILLESWSGLGYYRRIRQMQLAAQRIVSEHGGRIPGTYEGLLALPGIGAYTAAAIASICFRLPHAVVDGNVVRVLTRLADDLGDIGKSEVRARIQETAQALLELAPPRRVGEFNQALMELGATFCVPRNPRCLVCPVAANCRARKKGVQGERPVKVKKERAERLELAVVLVRRQTKLLMRQRPADASLMPGFWELPEVSGPQLSEDCFANIAIRRGARLGEFRHGITFREFRGAVYRGSSNGSAPDGYAWVPEKRLTSLPLTTITRKALAIAAQPKPASVRNRPR